MTSPLELFALASVVELHGLVSTPHHNGRRGVVLRASGANNERLEVQLEQVSGSETPARLAVRPLNVREVPKGDVSLALLRLSSFAIVDRIAEVQSLGGTEGYDPAEHMTLIELNQQITERITTEARTQV
jgi:hypothetical protein